MCPAWVRCSCGLRWTVKETDQDDPGRLRESAEHTAPTDLTGVYGVNGYRSNEKEECQSFNARQTAPPDIMAITTWIARVLTTILATYVGGEAIKAYPLLRVVLPLLDVLENGGKSSITHIAAAVKRRAILCFLFMTSLSFLFWPWPRKFIGQLRVFFLNIVVEESQEDLCHGSVFLVRNHP